MNDSGEFYRRHLPHWQPAGATFFVTFRLADSIPYSVIKLLRAERDLEEASINKNNLEELPNQGFLEEERFFRKLDSVLDNSNTGPHWLNQPEIANIVGDALHYRHKRFFDLFTYCIMPNHVHVVFKPLKKDDREYYKLNRIMQSLKRYTAQQANRVLGREGTFWQAESYDHVIRDVDELNRIIYYMITNPLKAGLVKKWEDWRWTFVRDEFNPFKQA